MIINVTLCDICKQKIDTYISILINNLVSNQFGEQLKEIHICHECKLKSVNALLQEIPKEFKQERL